MAFPQKMKAAAQLRFLPYLLCIPIILFEALSLSGCVSNSPSLPDLYIVSFTRDDTSPPLHLRLGYFGMCAGNDSALHCHPTTGSSSGAARALLFPGHDNSTAADALVTAARAIQSRVLVPVLAAAAVLLLAGAAALPLAARRPAARPPAVAALCLSAALALTAALATAQAAGALQHAAPLLAAAAAPRPGTPLQVLQWLAFAGTAGAAAAALWVAREEPGGGMADEEKF